MSDVHNAPSRLGGWLGALAIRRWRDRVVGRAPSAGVAQLVEHLPCKQGVAGSSPFASSTPVNVNISEGCPSGQREQTVNLPASCLRWFKSSTLHDPPAGVAQLVERQPSKLNVAGSNPVSRSPKNAQVAQR